MWPQWWSFVDMSQQGVDFSKKSSKIKIIFWFDFQRSSHGPSKIENHFRKQSGSKIWSFQKKIRKIQMIFDKVRFRHFLTTDVNICKSHIKKYFSFPDFLLKWSPFWLMSTKLHHWGQTKSYVYRSNHLVKLVFWSIG